MDLRKRVSGASDWDVLSSDTGLKISGESNGDMLVLGAFYPIEIVIYPQEGKAEIYYRMLRQTFKIEIPLAIRHEMEIPLEWCLGILKRQEGIEISIPLARIVKLVMDMSMPLKIKPIELHIQVSSTGKTQFVIKSLEKGGKLRRKTIKTLQALREYLKKSS